VNRKRVCRIMQGQSLLLVRRCTEGFARTCNGKIAAMRSTLRSTLRWCRGGVEFACWNGDIVRGAFIIDARDREIIAWRRCKRRHQGSDVRDMILAAVEARFAGRRAPHQVEMLSDDGSLCIAKGTRIFARQLGLEPCHTPAKCPQSNGMSEAFVTTLKRDHGNVTPLPDAAAVLGSIAGWFEDHDDHHPHSGLKMRLPREFIAAQTATA
jgi:transposase InsO family protein